MIDFSQNELFIQNLISDREREAVALASAPKVSKDANRHYLRASIAAKLVRLALRLDRETAGALVARESGLAGRRG